MSEITQADRGLAKRIIVEFRPDGWPTKEEELAGTISRYRLQARTQALEEAKAGLFEAIAHGDEEHRAWLKGMVHGWFARNLITQDTTTTPVPGSKGDD